jgi:hypothetical protein
MSTANSFRVNPAGLHAESNHCEIVASELSAVAVAAAPVAVSTWQATAERANIYNSSTQRLLASARARIRSAATELTEAATGYECNEAESATKLRAVGAPRTG